VVKTKEREERKVPSWTSERRREASLHEEKRDNSDTSPILSPGGKKRKGPPRWLMTRGGKKKKRPAEKPGLL